MIAKIKYWFRKMYLIIVDGPAMAELTLEKEAVESESPSKERCFKLAGIYKRIAMGFAIKAAYGKQEDRGFYSSIAEAYQMISEGWKKHGIEYDEKQAEKLAKELKDETNK